MKNNNLSTLERNERILLGLFFLAIGSLIYFVFSPLRPVLDKVSDYLGRGVLIVVLLAAVLLVRKSARFEKYWQVMLGLLIMTVTVSFDRIFSIYLMDYLGVDANTAMDWALQKLNECVVVVSVVVALTLLSGGSLGSIYIQKGNLKLGLIIGVSAFCLAAAGSVLMANLLFKPQDLTLARIISWAPWLLIFVLANGTQEELLFRGLFLRKLQPFLGNFLSNVMIMFIFTMLHRGVPYTSNEYIFLAAVILLALAWGYIMQKTGSIWGSILFHAGMDIPIMLGMFSNLP